MNDEEFISYCESHCETPRGGFVAENIVRILRLAGDTDLADEWADVDPRIIASIGPEAMLPVCQRARQALSNNRRGE